MNKNRGGYSDRPTISVFSSNVLAVLDSIRLDMQPGERPRLGDFDYVDTVNVEELEALNKQKGTTVSHMHRSDTFKECEQFLRSTDHKSKIGVITEWAKARLFDIDCHRLEKDLKFFKTNYEKVLNWRNKETGSTYMHHIIRFKDDISVKLIKLFWPLLLVADSVKRYPLSIVIEKGFSTTRDGFDSSQLEKTVFQISYPTEKQATTMTPFEKSVFGLYAPPKVLETGENQETNVENAQKFSMSSMAHKSVLNRQKNSEQLLLEISGIANTTTNNTNDQQLTVEDLGTSEIEAEDKDKTLEEEEENEKSMEAIKPQFFIESESLKLTIFSRDHNKPRDFSDLIDHINKVMGFIPVDKSDKKTINDMIEKVLLGLNIESLAVIYTMLTYFNGDEYEKRSLAINYRELVGAVYKRIDRTNYMEKLKIQIVNELILAFCHDETVIFDTTQYDIEQRIKSIVF